MATKGLAHVVPDKSTQSSPRAASGAGPRGAGLGGAQADVGGEDAGEPLRLPQLLPHLRVPLARHQEDVARGARGRRQTTLGSAVAN